MKRLMMVAGVTIFTLAILSTAFAGEASMVRRSACKGSWYAAEREALEKQVDGFLERVTSTTERQRIIGMISPHAGYVYSGEIAAWGYRNLSGSSVRRVIILAPSHYVRFEGLSTPRVAFYETPLGKVKVDTEACEYLLKKPLFRSIREAHDMEHAVEMQLPFLQRTLGDFDLIPLVVGGLREGDYERISHELKAVQDVDTLVIASSDFTHFGPRFRYVPFVENLRENISRIDQGAIDLILKKDWKGFLAYRDRTQATICGFRPIALLLQTLPPDAKGRLLRYALSGDSTGDYTNSVSYASIVFVRDDK